MYIWRTSAERSVGSLDPEANGRLMAEPVGRYLPNTLGKESAVEKLKLTSCGEESKQNILVGQELNLEKKKKKQRYNLSLSLGFFGEFSSKGL